MSIKDRLCNFLLKTEIGNNARKEFNEQQKAFQDNEPYTRTWKTVLAAQERGYTTICNVYKNLGEEATAIEFAEIIKDISFLESPLDNVMTFAEATEELECAAGYLNSLVKREILIEGEDFRRAGRVCLIEKRKVEELKKLK